MELVIGHVDDNMRALITVPIAASDAGQRTALAMRIDTAFNGGLVIPRKHIASIGLVKESSAEGILADGTAVQLETYGCFLEWFGIVYQTQVIASNGEFPLLGTMLLSGHKLKIDYESKTVAIT